MTFDNALKVATAVATDTMASGSKRKRVSGGEESATASKKKRRNTDGFRIINKKEFLLTYADTRGITTKSDVALVLEEKQKNIEFIVSKEKNQNGDIALDHIHSYVNFVEEPLNTRNLRYFDVEYPPNSNQPFPTNHPNIKYKGEFNKNPIQATINMIKYVTKEDQDPICNFDWKKRLEELKAKLNNKRGKSRDVLEIPFYEWVNEDPRPDGEEVKCRIRSNKVWYDQYCLKFINFNSLIKAEFDCRRDLKDGLSLSRIGANKYDGPRGLVLMGPPKSGKTSLLACLGTFSYFPNIWDMKNWEQNAEFNWFEDQDVIFESMEDFRWFKGFVGSQQVLTMTDKYCVKKRKKSFKGKDSATASKKRRKDTDGFRIINKKEFLLTYADTRGVTTKNDVALMLEEKQRSSQSSPKTNKIEQYYSSDDEDEEYYLNVIKRKRDTESEENDSIPNKRTTTESDITNQENSNNSEPINKKKGRKPIFKNPKILDPSIYNNKTIQDAKKANKKDRDKRRLEDDVNYDEEMNEDNVKKKTYDTLHDVFKAIVMLKDSKEYNLYEVLSNTNAGIIFIQLLAVSPVLRKFF
ncbi:hypothetical protein PIROE2DRAFT_56708 [Piromyces sp. E2]|nr:hypothetical protein PIROE2DRAFT_56708 [Piromyces sp. E2]|eukprot:OUM70669.1 hypothetical protein PIROE2DRAFT_56708 [Piromyces sp. E2]